MKGDPKCRALIKMMVVGGCLLIPLWYSGLTRHSIPFLPQAVSQFYRVAGVFEHSSSQPTTYKAEIRRNELENWTAIDLSDSFLAKPWGHRDRFQLLIEMFQSENGHQGRKELAGWLASRLPDTSEKDEIRFLRIQGERMDLLSIHSPRRGIVP